MNRRSRVGVGLLSASVQHLVVVDRPQSLVGMLVTIEFDFEFDKIFNACALIHSKKTPFHSRSTPYL